ncbi:hypothetical protein G6F36_013418 [Rhizopus arrhizus]|nr:hypothetical protein G6F36_013418 [Rhizopus arrhizus]
MPILDKPSSTSTHSPSLSDEKPQEQTTTWAWLGTVVCMVLNSSCAIMWMTASSTPTVMADWMAISLTQLNWLSNGSAILNALVSFITPLAYDKLGIRSSLILCGLLNALGCWVRTLAILVPIEKRYALFMTGQMIASLGGPLVYNLAAKFVSIWFAPKDRGLASLLLSIQVGMALGPLLLPLICPTVNQVPRMLLVVSGLSTLAALPTFLIPPQPAVPPCVSATLARDSLWHGLRSIATHAQFGWLTLMTSVTIGMILSVSVLIMEAIAPFGYSDQQAGLCAASVVFAGCLGGGKLVGA